MLFRSTGDLSRNRRVGLELARGTALSEVLARLGHVAEGVHTARAVRRLANGLAVDMPLTQAVCRVMDEGVPAREAVGELLKREPKAEDR